MTITTTPQTATIKHLLRDTDLSRPVYEQLLADAALLKREKASGSIQPHLCGLNVAVIFEKPSTRTRSAFEVALHEEGAGCTYMDSASSHLGSSESFEDTAHVLSRFFDGIAYRGFAQSGVDQLAEHGSIPVWNALTNEWHPTQALADMLTMRETSEKPLKDIVVTFLGDGHNNVANSLMTSAAILGMDVRIGAPELLQPDPAVIDAARLIASRSGARITVTTDVNAAIAGADFLYTDVWVSMGESDELWDQRVPLLLPYRIDVDLMHGTGNAKTQFLHCLPSIHDSTTVLGKKIYDRFGLDGAEVSNDVFRSPASRVYDQAENRMHTIKAIMLASFAPMNTGS
ncbi:ornithine carbamoyltransferase [Arthrobacter cryoconiti]|uniref:Ornithine carbamoyltransferase n=1 Tax=Arthrobacter cryoconiti TaxID=748907 RepID=A0ABV8QWI4_9MICC|nr:ornithine carbamoyltransferase [Arthrobacter cryoconiti]MCC9069683.1 ornithine carbamoyltransferase [Arthrobacter cryoconiti]